MTFFRTPEEEWMFWDIYRIFAHSAINVLQKLFKGKGLTDVDCQRIERVLAFLESGRKGGQRDDLLAPSSGKVVPSLTTNEERDYSAVSSLDEVSLKGGFSYRLPTRVLMVSPMSKLRQKLCFFEGIKGAIERFQKVQLLHVLPDDDKILEAAISYFRLLQEEMSRRYQRAYDACDHDD